METLAVNEFVNADIIAQGLSAYRPESASLAAGLAVREALQRHKQAGNSVAIWRNGRVEWIPPEEILTPPDEANE